VSRGRRHRRVCVTLLAALLASAAATQESFDLEAFRLRIATDRAAGLAEGRAALESGVFRDNPASRRTLLWYMGGAAVGGADDVALEHVVRDLQALAQQSGDDFADSLAGFLRGARLLDLGEVGEGLVEVLHAANAVAGSEDPLIQRTAAGELCRSYAAASRLDQALLHCRRHTRTAQESGDEAALARAEYLEASVRSYRGEHAEAVALWDSARQRFLRLGLKGLADRTAGSLASDLINQGDFAAALRMAQVALQAGEESGSAVSIAIASGYAGSALVGLGRGDEAVPVVERALATLAEIEHPTVEGNLLRVLMQALEATEGAGSPRLREAEARLEALQIQREPSPEQSDAIAAIEEQVRQRTLDLRIRELEREAELKALALETARREAEQQEAALRNQRTVAWLAVLASAALLIALLAVGLLLRAQRRLAASLHAQAYRDALTGLPNRRAFSERASQLLADPDARSQAHSLMLVDLDHFKSINDRGGHPLGDEVLIATGLCLQREAPAAAQVARLGGEEFAVLCPGLAGEAALALADRLCRAIAAQSFSLQGEPLRVTASIGLALQPAGSTRGLAAWMKAADQAMYRAKAEGRNRVAAA
jgi:diguanylate cyclase (GGDEF)-like protein